MYLTNDIVYLVLDLLVSIIRFNTEVIADTGRNGPVLFESIPPCAKQNFILGKRSRTPPNIRQQIAEHVSAGISL